MGSSATTTCCECSQYFAFVTFSLLYNYMGASQFTLQKKAFKWTSKTARYNIAMHYTCQDSILSPCVHTLYPQVLWLTSQQYLIVWEAFLWTFSDKWSVHTLFTSLAPQSIQYVLGLCRCNCRNSYRSSSRSPANCHRWTQRQRKQWVSHKTWQPQICVVYTYI